MDKIYLDEKGYQEYLKEIEEIREKIRLNSLDISEYQSDDAYGDGWHDNFAFEEARKKENTLFYELDEKLKGLNRIEIVNEKIKSGIIGINSVVKIKFDNDDEIETFFITGSTTSGMENGIQSITLNSPLAKAICGKRVNEIFSYSVGSNTINGKIVDINE